MQKRKYILEVYEPGNARDVMGYVESLEGPFMALNKGDLFNTSFLKDANGDRLLRIINLEHIIWKVEEQEPVHKILIFTEEVKDEAGIRTKK